MASRQQSHKHAESSHVDSPHDESSHAESSRAESFHVSEDESAALLARLHFSKSFLQVSYCKDFRLFVEMSIKNKSMLSGVIPGTCMSRALDCWT